MGANLERGTLLHKRYRIVEILGQGGMGSVYRAVDENLGVDVAVKENLFTTDDYAQQFRLEAVILATLRHPNLPRVTDHFVMPDQGQYLIMDYIAGEDLRQRMERLGKISTEEAIRVGAAMCNALQFLHTRKPVIIHRDLKPGNVRITPDGHIYLVDFGLAKLVKDGQATTTGARAMTPGYSPPEQYGSARTSPRTDIYSLGATLYAALSGVIPEDGLARAMDNVELTPLRKHNARVSHPLASAIEKAMSVHPEDRFQSAEEFKQALLSSGENISQQESDILVTPPPMISDHAEAGRSALEGHPPGKQGPPPAVTKASAGRGRLSGWLLGFILAFLILAAVAVGVFWSPITRAFTNLPAGSSPTPARATLTNGNPVPGTQIAPITDPPSAATLSSEAWTAIPSPSQSTTPTLLPTYLPPSTSTPSVTFGPTPTPQGGGSGRIAFASDISGLPQIYTMNADGSDPRQLTNMSLGACQAAWSPDGKQLVVTSPCPKRQDQYPGATLYLVNADGSGIPTGLPSVPGGDFDPAWSPDGRQIAFTSLRDGSRQIYVFDLTTDQVTPLTVTSGAATAPLWSAQPAWAPSGLQIIYTAYSRLTNTPQIWIMSSSGQDQKALILRGSELWNFIPAMHPDGASILLGETLGNQQLGWLMVYDLETTKMVHLRSPAFGTNGDYSPDGNWVVYESKDSEDLERLDYDIYCIRSDGLGAIQRLTNLTSMQFDVSWQPMISP